MVEDLCGCLVGSWRNRVQHVAIRGTAQECRVWQHAHSLVIVIDALTSM